VPEILILSDDDSNRLEIEKTVRAVGLRFKSALDLESALKWLDNWPFDGVILDFSARIDVQQKIAEKLWKSSPSAPLIVVNAKAELASKRFEQRLFGAEVLDGPDALKRLEIALTTLPQQREFEPRDMSFMVVDDLDSPRDIICSYLEHFGIRKVDGFRSTQEALNALKSTPKQWSGIITDLRMPELSGAVLIDKVRADPKLQGIPVVVLTAYGSADHLVECLRSGASGFLVKPPRREDFIRELGRAYRIFTGQASARLASSDEVEEIRAVLESKGYA
jgi:two-component system, chemotaxis family, chemotaxis protein CheY